MESLLLGFIISDLRDPSPSQILGTSSRFSGGLADRSRLVDDVPTSLADLGYLTVGIDTCWQDCLGRSLPRKSEKSVKIGKNQNVVVFT